MPGSLSGFYSGIIAEPPKTMNKFRYLVFFDDGYASYIPHKDIRAVTQQTETTVWMDIHPNSSEFIKKYLMQYPERPMVRLQQVSVNNTIFTVCSFRTYFLKKMDNSLGDW